MTEDEFAKRLSELSAYSEEQAKEALSAKLEIIAESFEDRDEVGLDDLDEL